MLEQKEKTSKTKIIHSLKKHFEKFFQQLVDTILKPEKEENVIGYIP